MAQIGTFAVPALLPTFLVAGLLSSWLGWRWAILACAVSAAAASLVVAVAVPAAPAAAPAVPPTDKRALLDFRPVFANRSAMAYALCYMVHTWEMSALR